LHCTDPQRRRAVTVGRGVLHNVLAGEDNGEEE